MKGDRIGWVVSALLTIFILVLIFDEDNKNSDLEINEKLRYHDLVAYHLKFDQNDPIIIVFLKDGTIRYLSHFVDGFEQQLDFHDNGYLAARTLVDSSGNIQLGRYHFYESYGNLSHRYNYFNNKKVGVANSFHANHFLFQFHFLSMVCRLFGYVPTIQTSSHPSKHSHRFPESSRLLLPKLTNFPSNPKGNSKLYWTPPFHGCKSSVIIHELTQRKFIL